MKSFSLRFAAMFLLSVILLLPVFTACSDDEYKMKASTEEELSTILTIGDQEVPYELFRAFFLTNADDIDEEEDWGKIWEEVMPHVLEDVSRIYAVFALCEEYGIDPYSDKIDKTLEKRVKIGIEGGTINGITIEGYGSYDAYLKVLEESFLTDSAYRLILRYQICEEELLSLLTNKETTSYEISDEALRALYESDRCRRVELAYGTTAILPSLEELLQNTKEKMLPLLRAATSDKERLNIYQQYFHSEPTDTLVTPYAFPSDHGEELLAAAFDLEVGEYSEPVVIYTETGEYVYLVRCEEKNLSDFDQFKKELEDLYLRDSFYCKLAEKEAALKTQITYTDIYTAKKNSPIVFEAN